MKWDDERERQYQASKKMVDDHWRSVEKAGNLDKALAVVIEGADRIHPGADAAAAKGSTAMPKTKSQDAQRLRDDLATLRSRLLDEEWNARSLLVAYVSVLVLARTPAEVQQYQLDELRELWERYQRIQRDRQEADRCS